MSNAKEEQFREAVGQTIFVIILLLSWLFVAVSVLSFPASHLEVQTATSDYSLNLEGREEYQTMGSIANLSNLMAPGRICADFLRDSLGMGAYCFIIIFGFITFSYWFGNKTGGVVGRTIGFCLLLFATTSIFAFLFDYPVESQIGAGGRLGELVNYYLKKLSINGSGILVFDVAAVIASSLLVFLQAPPQIPRKEARSSSIQLSNLSQNGSASTLRQRRGWVRFPHFFNSSRVSRHSNVRQSRHSSQRRSYFFSPEKSLALSQSFSNLRASLKDFIGELFARNPKVRVTCPSRDVKLCCQGNSFNDRRRNEISQIDQSPTTNNECREINRNDFVQRRPSERCFPSGLRYQNNLREERDIPRSTSSRLGVESLFQGNVSLDQDRLYDSQNRRSFSPDAERFSDSKEQSSQTPVECQDQQICSNLSYPSQNQSQISSRVRSDYIPTQPSHISNASPSYDVSSTNPFSTPEQYGYELPSVDLLDPTEYYDYNALSDEEYARGVELERVCKSFNVDITVSNVQSGPVLTLYEIAMKEGLRFNKLSALEDDIAIAMRAPNVRIVRSVPGKNCVGVEIPNQTRQLVRLREVMESCVQNAENMTIPIFLGKDVVGAPLVADLAKLPHLLIAGRTGTGKSVCLNSIIMSILMTRSPEQVKLIMIDPKMVELSPYKSIPHLMHPVVTDMGQAESILEWAVEKMEQRYLLFKKVGARQLSDFNSMPTEKMRENLHPKDFEEWAAFPKRLPSIVIIADEMADMIMTSGKDVERHIVRLAQKSRAVGIHLVLATQKPTVDVVTGLIKSNLPARIAFGVASRTDSSVVLDTKGAEQLLGNGDMLFLLPGTSQLVRGQGTFVSNSEIEAVIDSISVDEPDYEVVLPDKTANENDDIGSDEPSIDVDEYYVQAVELIISEGKASTSLLQRRLGVGYGRAARMIDMMADDGLISKPNPAKPSRPRDVLITLEEWRGKQGNSSNADVELDMSPQCSVPSAQCVSQDVPRRVDSVVYNAPLPFEIPAAPGPDGDTSLVASYERHTSFSSVPRSVVTDDVLEEDSSSGYNDHILTPKDRNQSQSSNTDWNQEEWKRYINCDDELGDVPDEGEESMQTNAYSSIGNLREMANQRRFNR